MRNNKIYISQKLAISEHPIEIYLDIEGIPDQQFYYLIGLIVFSNGHSEHHFFWADSSEDEHTIFISLIQLLKRFPDAPIYHYGSFEIRALDNISKNHRLHLGQIKKRLVNVNSFIFGKIYFPTRSNSLKDLGKFIGAKWKTSDSSGLQCLIWRYKWEETNDDLLKKKIVSYNKDDCIALQLIFAELRNISKSSTTRSDVDFSDIPKKNTTEFGQIVHNALEQILVLAHADYKRNSIRIGEKSKEENTAPKKCGAREGHKPFFRVMPKNANKIIRVRRPIKCIKHREQLIEPSVNEAEHILIDLVFTKSGYKKKITKYIGKMGYCPRCQCEYLPPAIRRFNGRLFGHSFRAFVIYQRIFLRLPLRVISQVTNDLFQEHISEGATVNFIAGMTKYYSYTERLLMKKILESLFIHVDETKINIRGIDHFVWVLTDGCHVVFKLTETREASIIHKIIKNYEGILISDFYPGYDACSCKQQKCLVHLIRDLNDDLWKNPFNTELEFFIGEFKNVLVPIMQDIDRFGLKKRYLNKHKRVIKRFYKKSIDKIRYRCEITQQYQKRFIRYKDSLFTFLEYDGIPWNNNMAERASRHLAVQRKISGSFFKSGALHYLTLLGIAQTCRFQGKSFFEFMLSCEKNVDTFKPLKTRRNLISGAIKG